MPQTIEQLFASIRDLTPDDINSRIAAHQAQIKMLRRVLLLINETVPVDAPDTETTESETTE